MLYFVYLPFKKFLVKQEANENEKYIAGNQDIMDEIE